MSVSIFLYNFSQRLNCLTPRDVRIAFFRGPREYFSNRTMFFSHNKSASAASFFSFSSREELSILRATYIYGY
jgi:hypothetical protein